VGKQLADEHPRQSMMRSPVGGGLLHGQQHGPGHLITTQAHLRVGHVCQVSGSRYQRQRGVTRHPLGNLRGRVVVLGHDSGIGGLRNDVARPEHHLVVSAVGSGALRDGGRLIQQLGGRTGPAFPDSSVRTTC
jgi:hypothetical protein